MTGTLLAFYEHLGYARNMLRSISDLMFPGVDHNTIIELLGDYFCKVLLEGSVNLNLDENKLLFDIVFKYIDESGRFNYQNEVAAHDDS